MITNEQIEQLRSDAMLVRNSGLAQRCTKALTGDSEARATVESVINGTYQPPPREPQSFPVTVTEPDGTVRTEWITV